MLQGSASTFRHYSYWGQHNHTAGVAAKQDKHEARRIFLSHPSLKAGEYLLGFCDASERPRQEQ